MNKNKVSDMAKDFGLTSKDILSVLSTYEDGSKKPSQVLSADEVNLIFEHLTQKHQVKIESIYAESAPQKKPEPKAAPAPAQNQPKANNAQNQPRNSNNNGGSRQFYGGDGIIRKGVENTLQNISRLGRVGMRETDREIIRMMVEEP